jgi:hypothetical protein
MTAGRLQFEESILEARSDSELTALGYIGIRSAQLEDWNTFATGLLGCNMWTALARCGLFAWTIESSA